MQPGGAPIQGVGAGAYEGDFSKPQNEEIIHRDDFSFGEVLSSGFIASERVWRTGAANTGTRSIGEGSDDNPGYAQITVPANGDVSFKMQPGWYKGADAIVLEGLLLVEAAPDGTNDYDWVFGFTDPQTSVWGNDGVYFAIERGTNATNILAVCRSTTATIEDTGVTIASIVGTYARFRIEKDAGTGTVRFYINGTLVATITTNIPATVSTGYAYAIEKQLGATSRYTRMDYVYYKRTFATPR